MGPELKATKNLATQLIRILCEYTKSEYDLNTMNDDTHLFVGDIEDMAVGYRQNNVKLFAFGKLHASQMAFEAEDDDYQADKKGADKDAGKETNMMKKLKWAIQKENGD